MSRRCVSRWLDDRKNRFRFLGVFLTKLRKSPQPLPVAFGLSYQINFFSVGIDSKIQYLLRHPCPNLLYWIFQLAVRKKSLAVLVDRTQKTQRLSPCADSRAKIHDCLSVGAPFPLRRFGTRIRPQPLFSLARRQTLADHAVTCQHALHIPIKNSARLIRCRAANCCGRRDTNTGKRLQIHKLNGEAAAKRC